MPRRGRRKGGRMARRGSDNNGNRNIGTRRMSAEAEEPRPAAGPPGPGRVRGRKKGFIMPTFFPYAIFFSLALTTFRHINHIQPEPYLDEVFHVPQTQIYCNGSFDQWDPKITTLPGTYYVASFAVKSIEKLGFGEDPSNSCSTYRLRLFNWFMGWFNFVIIKEIVGIHMQGESDWKIMVSAINISMFPVLYFFNFLYYTDVTSTFWLLLMHLGYLRRNFVFSTWTGGMAVLTRQTNVVWIGWHGLLLMFKYLNTAATTDIKSIDGEGDNQKYASDVIVRKPLVIAKKFIKEVLQDFPRWIGYLLVACAFVVFVVVNGGIVVGDKTAHVATFNFPQLGYFAIVFGFFASPFMVIRFFNTVSYALKRKFLIIVATAAFVVAVYLNTVAHPYLLADNRHYPFYVWKNVYQANFWARYALIPYYVFVWAFIFGNLHNTSNNHYSLALFLSATLQLVPQLLLEFRYFIPVYLMARFAIQKPTWLELILESALFFVINLTTIVLFLYKPFFWASSDDVQRFMW